MANKNNQKYSYFFDTYLLQYLRVEMQPFDQYRLQGINDMPVYNALVMHDDGEIRRVAVTQTFLDLRCKPVKCIEVRASKARALTHQVGW